MKNNVVKILIKGSSKPYSEYRGSTLRVNLARHDYVTADPVIHPVSGEQAIPSAVHLTEPVLEEINALGIRSIRVYDENSHRIELSSIPANVYPELYDALLPSCIAKARCLTNAADFAALSGSKGAVKFRHYDPELIAQHITTDIVWHTLPFMSCCNVPETRSDAFLSSAIHRLLYRKSIASIYGARNGACHETSEYISAATEDGAEYLSIFDRLAAEDGESSEDHLCERADEAAQISDGLIFYLRPVIHTHASCDKAILSFCLKILFRGKRSDVMDRVVSIVRSGATLRELADLTRSYVYDQTGFDLSREASDTLERALSTAPSARACPAGCIASADWSAARLSALYPDSDMNALRRRLTTRAVEYTKTLRHYYNIK